MNLVTRLRNVSQRIAIIGGITAVSIVAATATLAWGPDRPTYTMERPADHVTFNSITNNPNYGDEREFVTIKDLTKGGSLTNNATLIPGHEYKVQIYVHNNAHSDLNASGKGVAKNTMVRAALPSSVNGTETVDGFVSASNATPGTVYDSALLKSNGKVDLQFVNGSAMLHTNRQQTKLPDSVITTGTKVGDKDLSGDWRGCLDFAGAVTFKIKVKEAPKADFTMDKQVRKHGEKRGWQEHYKAQPGETVDFIIRYKNTGQVTQENVAVKDKLPQGLQYVPGSTKLGNSGAPSGVTVSDNVTTKGINIGSYAPGANAWVMFSAKVATTDELECGPQTMKNVASVTTGKGTKSDDATVAVTGEECEEVVEKVEVCNPETGEIITVNKDEADQYVPVNSPECKEAPVQEEEAPEADMPEALPQTGPMDVIAQLAGVISLTAASAYYVASRRLG